MPCDKNAQFSSYLEFERNHIKCQILTHISAASSFGFRAWGEENLRYAQSSYFWIWNIQALPAGLPPPSHHQCLPPQSHPLPEGYEKRTAVISLDSPYRLGRILDCLHSGPYQPRLRLPWLIAPPCLCLTQQLTCLDLSCLPDLFSTFGHDLLL